MKLVDFTQSVIDKYRLVLARSAQDRNARELLTTRYGVVEIMPQTPRITRNKLLDKLVKLEVATAVARDQLFALAKDPKPPADAAAAPKANEPVAAKATVNIRPSIVNVLTAKGYDLAQIDYAAKVIGKGVVRPNSDSLFLPDDTVITGLMVRDGIITKKEAKVRGENTIIGIGPDGVSLTQSLPMTEIESILLTSGKEEEQAITLMLQCNYLGVVFPLSTRVRLAGGAGAQEVIRFGGVRASKDIIDHLNANKLHYSQAIYQSLDTSSLALLLSPYSYKGKPLVQLIDPTPVTIAGNYLVFKMHEEESEVNPKGEEVLSEWGRWLKDHGITKSRVKTELTPLPSGGVFAEAVLGRYNAAEKLDMTRFWNWQDSPIPLAAPEIAPIEMASRGTTEDVKPGQLGAPVVSIVNPTALPDPTGMAAVLQAIQNGNMFRDMSGLAATMGLAQAGINAASQGATAAGAQAGSNAAVAAQLLSDLAKTAASVMTMGVGGAIGGAAGGLLSAGGGGGGGNISNAGALMNQGRSMAERGAGGASAPGGVGNSGGGQAGGAGGGVNGGGNGSGGGSAPSNDGSGAPNLEEQAFNRALWGQSGESQGDFARDLFKLTSGSGTSKGTTPKPAQSHYVVISVRDDQADNWASHYVAKQPLQRRNLNMPANPNSQQVLQTFRAAAASAGSGGVVIINVGHGGISPVINLPMDGLMDLAPGKMFRLGGLNVANSSVNVFYDISVVADAIPQLLFDQQNPNSPAAQKRLADWQVYKEIGNALRSAGVYKVVVLACRVGNATDFIKKVANDWGVVVEAYKDFVALQMQASKRVRIYLASDGEGKGTNVPLGEEELPLANEFNSYRAGPPILAPGVGGGGAAPDVINL